MKRSQRLNIQRALAHILVVGMQDGQALDPKALFLRHKTLEIGIGYVGVLAEVPDLTSTRCQPSPSGTRMSTMHISDTPSTSVLSVAS